ncbi:MAG: hypothetical protein ABIQ99_01140 [Thermoflexales bacterium]
MPNPANPQSLNRYAAMANNPLKFTDPTGHDPAGSQNNCNYAGVGCDDATTLVIAQVLSNARIFAANLAWNNRNLHPKLAKQLNRYSIGRDIVRSGILNQVRFRDTFLDFGWAASYSNSLQSQGLYPIDLPPGWTQETHDGTLKDWSLATPAP